MIKSLFSFLGLFLFTTYAFPQQNFFNVPSSDITQKHHLFAQQQLNVYNPSIVSNSTVCYGLGNKSEIGLNIVGVTYDKKQENFISNSANEQPVFPSLGFNAQKEIVELNSYHLALGGQLLFPKPLRDLEWYFYVNNKFEFKHIKLIAGLFTGNNNYFSPETKLSPNFKLIGLQFGIEYEIIADKLYLQSDFITGRTELSNLIVGCAYKLTKKLIISSGYQIPNNNNTSLNGLIVELTYIQ